MIKGCTIGGNKAPQINSYLSCFNVMFIFWVKLQMSQQNKEHDW